MGKRLETVFDGWNLCGISAMILGLLVSYNMAFTDKTYDPALVPIAGILLGIAGIWAITLFPMLLIGRHMSRTGVA